MSFAKSVVIALQDDSVKVYTLSRQVTEISGNIPHSFTVQIKKIICTLLTIYKINYRLTHSASELSGFTCTSSLTVNEKIQFGIENFEFTVSEQVQVNPDNSRAMSALTFLLFKLNTLQTKIVKL